MQWAFSQAGAAEQGEKKRGRASVCWPSPLGWRRPTFPRTPAVSSALAGLTSLFGMARGGSPPPKPPPYGAPTDTPRKENTRGQLRRTPAATPRPAPAPSIRAISAARLRARAPCTCGLSTRSSTAALERGLISGRASRLDALSAYPLRAPLPGGAAGAATGTR